MKDLIISELEERKKQIKKDVEMLEEKKKLLTTDVDALNKRKKEFGMDIYNLEKKEKELIKKELITILKDDRKQELQEILETV